MTLTGTWIKNPAGTPPLILKWAPGEAPVRHRRNPHHPGISETKHHD
jgi:hypothetical protein